MFKTEPTFISVPLAACAGAVTAAFLWLVLFKGFQLSAFVSVGSAIIFGLIQFFVFRYILSQKYYPDKEEI